MPSSSSSSSPSFVPTEVYGSYGNYPIQSVYDEIQNCIEFGIDYSPITTVANRFKIEIGEKPGSGCVLMIQSDADNLIQGATYSLIIGVGDTTENAVKRYVELKNVVFHHYERVYPGDIEDENSLVYVFLTDIRFYLNKSFIDRFYNIHPIDQANDWSSNSASSADSSSSAYWSRSSANYYPSTLGGSGSSSSSNAIWKWANILTDIWSKIGSVYAGSAPIVPCSLLTEMDETPDRIRYNAISAYSAYCQALKRLGISVAFDPYYGGMTSQSSSSSSGSSSSCAWRESPFYWVVPRNDDPNAQIVASTYDKITLHTDYSLESDFVFIPDQINVCFNAEYTGSTTEQYHLRKYYVGTYTFAQYLIDKSLSPDDYETLAGTIEIIWGDLDARFPTYPADAYPANPVLSPINKKTLDRRAAELGRRFYDLRTTPETFSKTYSGCLPVRLSGLVHEIEWYDDGTGWKTQTTCIRDNPRFFSSPEDIQPRDVVPGSGSGSSTGGTVVTSGCNCLNCLSQSQVIIGGCSAASSGAAYQYILSIGTWLTYINLTPNGQISLTYASATGCSGSSVSNGSSSSSSTGCIWYSCAYQVYCPSSSSGSSSSSSSSAAWYQWQGKIYTDAFGLPAFKCVPVLISGTDCLGIAETL